MTVLLLAGFSIFQSCSQTVPNVVKDAFSKKFLEAREIIWQKGPHNDWAVTFYLEKFNYMTAYYTSKGAFVAFEIEVYDDDVPQDLVQRVLLKYPSAKIYSVFEKKTLHDTEYIFEVIDNGDLLGLSFKKDKSLTVIPKDDYRFQARIIIEND